MQPQPKDQTAARERRAVSTDRSAFGPVNFAPSTSHLRPPHGAGAHASPGRILVVEDASHAQPIRRTLEEQGYHTHVVGSALQCEELDLYGRFDAILMDAVLPDSDGVDLCRHLRQRKIAAPILVLSKTGSIADAIRALDAGADAYLTMPLHSEELLARLRGYLRRSKVPTGADIQSGDLVMNLVEHRVTVADTPVTLTAKEFALLHYMMRNPRKLLSRAMLIENVWEANYRPSSNVVDVYVSSLRRKVDRDPHRRRIETVVGSGYRFIDLAAKPEARISSAAAG